MSSYRSIELDLSFQGETPNPYPIPLGSTIQTRGTIELDDVVYPRLTGFRVERPTLSVVLSPGASSFIFLDSPLTGDDFVTEGVVYSPSVGVTFPYAGVYRVRMGLAYSMVTPGTTTSLDISITGSPVQRVAISDTGVFTYDRLTQTAGVDTVIVTNTGTESIQLQGSDDINSDVQTFLEAIYVGPL